MSTSLTDAIDNNLFQSMNALANRSTVQVYVESIDDIAFWDRILNESSQLYDISAYSDSDLNVGRDRLICMADRLGDCLIICVDAQYDFILSKLKRQSFSEHLCGFENSYILHTYVHSMDSYWCFHKNVRSAIVSLCGFTNFDLDFCFFNKRLSEISSDLLSVFIFMMLKKEPIIHDELKSVILPAQGRLCNKIQCLSYLGRLESKVASFVAGKMVDILRLCNGDMNVFEAFKADLFSIVNKNSDEYLFFQSHIMIDHIYSHLVGCMSIAGSNRIFSIIRQCSDDEVASNQRNMYLNFRKRIDGSLAALGSAHAYHDVAFIEKIKLDVSAV